MCIEKYSFTQRNCGFEDRSVTLKSLIEYFLNMKKIENECDFVFQVELYCNIDALERIQKNSVFCYE